MKHQIMIFEGSGRTGIERVKHGANEWLWALPEEVEVQAIETSLGARTGASRAPETFTLTIWYRLPRVAVAA